MKNSDDRAAGLQVATEGFLLFESIPNTGPFSGHIHADLEISVFEHGSVTMLYAGRVMRIPPRQLIVHWGIIPHQMLDREPSAMVAGLHVPLAWFLQWELPRTLVSRILNLDIIVDSPRHQPCSDLELMRNWIEVAKNNDSEGREIVLLEVHSRLRRMALNLDHIASATSQVANPSMAPGAFDRAVEYIAKHYLKPIRIPEIAKTAGVSRTHMMRIFRQTTGWTINEYITHLRLSHAQRLLITTNQKVIDIIYESGFNSLNRFYAVFKQETGLTPQHFRNNTLTQTRKEYKPNRR